jgi:glycosyltransferase involved in cell wall biosynthesis
MKIVHINRIWGPCGGAEQYLINLIQSLQSNDVESAVIYSKKSDIHGILPDIKSFRIDGINVRNSNDLTSFKKILVEINPDLIFLHNTSNYHLIDYVADKWPSARMIHDHELYCWRPSRMLRPLNIICKRSFSVLCYLFGCSITFENRKGRRLRLRHHLQKLAEIKANQNILKIIVASRYMQKQLLSNGFKQRQIRVVPPYCMAPINLDPGYYTKTETSKMILFVGRIGNFKGLGDLLIAFSRLDGEYSLTVIGDGPYLPKAKKISKELKIENRVKFLGWLQNDLISEYYNAAEFVVMPSLWPEPFGIVGIEAMAHAKAIIAYGVGGIPDWLKDGVNGYLVERGNIKKLTEALKEMLSDPFKSRKMGLDAHKCFLHNYTPEIYIPSLMKIFEEAIRDYKTRRSKNSWIAN